MGKLALLVGAIVASTVILVGGGMLLNALGPVVTYKLQCLASGVPPCPYKVAVLAGNSTDSVPGIDAPIA